MLKRRFWHSFVALMLLCSLLGQGTWVLAGTTGGVSGAIIDADSGQPIAAVTITVSSPSQSASRVTDAKGTFSFISLAPDTYVVSAEKSGYDPVSLPGITVQADQTRALSLSAHPALKEVARVSTRSAGSLVKPGITADVYSVNAAQQQAAGALGGGNNLNSAYSAIASVPGTFVPIGNVGWGQSILIRGGDYTQTGNEVDGIPINRSFDQYSASNLSSLGNAEVQVYTGNAPSDAQANGLAGYVNQVIRTGTYPGFGNVSFGLGTPAYYHQLGIEVGGASPNRNFSYYGGFTGYNQDVRIVDQFNGRGVTGTYGSLYNYIASGCQGAHPSAGCYTNGPTAGVTGDVPLGPNGYALAPTIWAFEPTVTDREGLVNLHFGVPHKQDGLKDDIQLLYNVGQQWNTPNSSMNLFGSAKQDIIDGSVTANGVTIPNYSTVNPDATSCAGFDVAVACAGAVSPFYMDWNRYTGPLNAPLTEADLGQVANVYFPGPKRTELNAAVPLKQRDGETTGFAVTKVQYQHNFSSSAYLRAYGYTLYSDRIDNGIVGLFQNYLSAFSPDYLISSHTRGGALTFADQINSKNLVNLTAAYSTSKTSRNRNDSASGSGVAPIAYLVSSANPLGGCYGVQSAVDVDGNAGPGTFQQVPCAGIDSASTYAAAYKYLLPVLGGTALRTATLKDANGNIVGVSPTVADASALSCGGAPCEYYSINEGPLGAINTVTPKFTNLSFQDTFRANDRLTLQAGLRYENFQYDMRQVGTDGNVLLTNDYNNTHCISGTTITSRALGAACPAGTSPTTLSATAPTLAYQVWSPRFGLTYTIDPSNVIRASYGRFSQPAETSAVEAVNFQAGTPSVAFYQNFGFDTFSRAVSPAISYNSDLTWQHAFKGGNASFALTPFYRKTQNEFVSILVDPKTNFVANINGANREVKGVELALRKGDFARNGFAGQLAYTYTHATNKYRVFSTGGSIVTAANDAIKQYNAYTSYCSTHTDPKLCGATSSGAAAAPCYTTTGAADPSCAATSVANPYWNAPVGQVLDPNASFVPYNENIGLGSDGTAASYFVPHVVALVLNYKHDRLSITPSIQFQAGARYGSPLSAQGVAPDSCAAILAAGSVTGDTRYQYGAAGGAPYDASTCATAIGIPDPYTKKFDGIGDFVQPNLLATNLSVSYEASSKTTLTLTAANIYNRCFGGSNVPWGVGNLGCAYNQTAPWVGNFYNPGDQIQNGYQYPYTPVLATSLQSVNAQSSQPFQLFLSAKIKL